MIHGELFPAEAFPEDPETQGKAPIYTELGVHLQFVKKLHEARIDAIGEDRYLTLDEEQNLSDAIQAGIKAEEAANNIGSRYNGCYDNDINDGKRAQYILVVANLPFAAFLARASAGILPKNNGEVHPQALPCNARSNIGTYTKICKLATPTASLEDRTQVAMEALWDAAKMFIPYNKASEGPNNATTKQHRVKFSTYAAWRIQTKLQLHAATEVRGWDVAPHILNQYYQAIAESNFHGVEPRSIRHIRGGSSKIGQHPSTVFEGRIGVTLDEAGKWVAAEEEDVLGEKTQLKLEDIAPSMKEDGLDSVERSVAFILMRDKISLVLDSLPEREARIIKMRFGLDGNNISTLDDVGREFNITRERVRQIESKIMSKLRHHSKSTELWKVYDYYLQSLSVTAPNVLGALISETQNIRTQRTIAHPYEEPENSRPAELEPWQAYLGDDWDEFVA